MKLGDIVDIIETGKTGEIIEILKISKRKKVGTVKSQTWSTSTSYKLKDGKMYTAFEVKLNVALSRDNRLKKLLKKRV